MNLLDLFHNTRVVDYTRRFEVLIEVAMKITVLWYVTQFSLVDIYKYFGATLRLSVQRRFLCAT
jgi:hypothetical protein